MAGQTVVVDGRRLTLTNLDKVLYPATGTTKADVLSYLAAVAPVLLPHCAERPVTRKRWPEGTDGPVFFQKNLDAGTPSWVRRREIRHRSGTTSYPIVDDLATLTWLGQVAALELHVPQWRFGRTGTHLPPDRLVLDLDPGPGAGLAECAEVARLARTVLTGMGLDPFPVTSGSKGIHLYAALDGSADAAAVSAVAHELARHLESAHGDLVVADMKKALRGGKVLVDWSQNNGAKTTIAPYSLRGRERPYVAAPRTWDELNDPGLAHLEADEVRRRVEERGDHLAGLTAGHLAVLEPTPRRMATFTAAGSSGGPGTGGAGRTAGVTAPGASGADTSSAAGSGPADRLTTYRSMRDGARTPEPVPDAPPVPGPGNTFVVQEHHARRLHWDFRLERDGVLVSWALPRGEPTDPGRNHLAVQTEDHPLAYGAFEGTIPAGEYGAGQVMIWDAGTYETEKWREGSEVIVVLHGERHGTRRLALIHTGDAGGTNWLVHRMKDSPARSAVGADHPPAPTGAGAAGGEEGRVPGLATPGRGGPPHTRRGALPRPMLAAPGTRADLTAGAWAYEMKWDGFRALVEIAGGVRVVSRSGIDMSATFPELAAARDLVADADTPLVLDAEIVALDRSGRPSFRRLQQRANLVRPRDVAAARARVGVDLMVFDVLTVAGRDVTGLPYRERRELLGRVLDASGPVHVPPAFDGDLDAALATSRRLGLEGLVAKRQDGPYVPGRSRGWVKIKHVRMQEVVVVGWRPGHGDRGHLMGSLLLAVPHSGGLRYVGRVGSGFSDAERRDLPGSLRRRASPAATGVPDEDARDAVWVRADRVAEVTYGAWTGDDDGGPGKLRHAVWRGWRPDKSPVEVVAEGPH